MSSVDIEVGLSEEDIAIRDVAHQYAEDVLRPAGVAMDRMTDPADTIGPDSPVCSTQGWWKPDRPTVIDRPTSPQASSSLTTAISRALR